MNLWKLTPLLALSLAAACADKGKLPPPSIGLAAADVAELNTPVPAASVKALEDSDAGRIAKARDDIARDDWSEMHWRAWGRICRTLAGQGVAVGCPVGR